jgi:hypothetical protein
MTADAPAAFWSYTHFDDAHDEKMLAKLRSRLAGEVRVQTGVSFQIYVDEEHLRAGQRWRSELAGAASNAQILIAIVTPSYFRSEACKEEYVMFRGREQELRRSPVNPATNAWAHDISERQYFDWRNLRFKSQGSIQVQEAIQKLARSIRATLAAHLQSAAATKDVSRPVHRFDIDFAESVDRAFLALSRTQRHIIEYMYKHLHREEIALDDLFSLFCHMHGSELVSGTAELHYRIKDLAHQHLLTLHPVGLKTTVVASLPEVGDVLFTRKRIDT